MLPSSSTRIINAVIGLCTETSSFVHPLADLGYKIDAIEQSTTEESTETVIVAASDKMLHSIVFYCKSGDATARSQNSRYRDLAAIDLSKWTKARAAGGHSYEICIVDFAENHDHASKQAANFPALSLSASSLKKYGKFSNAELEKQFRKPISLKNFKLPISYYPFSESDDRRAILPFVLRAMISLLSIKKSSNLDMSNLENLSQEILALVHKLWNKFSKKHQRQLQRQTAQIVKNLTVAYPKLKNQMSVMQSSNTANASYYSSLTRTCYEILEKEETTTHLDEFMNKR